MVTEWMKSYERKSSGGSPQEETDIRNAQQNNRERDMSPGTATDDPERAQAPC